MMFVYILKSLKDASYYIGMSSEPEVRLKTHNSGRVISTKNKVPWIRIHLEEFDSRIKARKREKYLKSAAGRRWRKNNLGI